MARKDLSQTLNEIETLIQQGSFQRARKVLQPIFKKRVPREHLVQLASLARRAFMAEKSIKLLNRLVRPSARSTSELATDAEKAEYAAALDFIGAYNEAIEILSELDGAKYNLVFLFHAFAEIRQWNWQAAIPLLQKYIDHPQTNPAQVFAGKLYLSSALLHEEQDLDRAKRLVDDVIANTQADPQSFLYKNALLLEVQAHARRREFKEGEQMIRRIEKECVDGTDPYYATLVEKWKCLLSLYESADRVAVLKRLGAVRERLLELRVWERARACDYYAAMLSNDRNRMLYLYFGTPYPELRKKLAERLGGESQVPRTYDWWLNRELDSNKQFVFDISNGDNNQNAKARLKEGQLPQRVLQAMCSDFYRPPRIAELHLRLYPNVPYNPVFSPDKIHHAMQRLRRWLERLRLPLEIDEKQGFYFLRSSIRCTLKITRLDELPQAREQGATLVKVQLLVNRLRDAFHDQGSFSAKEAAQALRSSDRSTVRYLREARDHGLLIQKGKGPATRYLFPGGSPERSKL